MCVFIYDKDTLVYSSFKQIYYNNQLILKSYFRQNNTYIGLLLMWSM